MQLGCCLKFICGVPGQTGQGTLLLCHRSGTCDMPSWAATELRLWLRFLTPGPVPVHSESGHSAGAKDSHVTIPVPEWLWSVYEWAARFQCRRPSCL